MKSVEHRIVFWPHTATRGGGLTRSSLPSLFAQFLLGKLAGMRVLILELVRLERAKFCREQVKTDCAVDKEAQKSSFPNSCDVSNRWVKWLKML